MSNDAFVSVDPAGLALVSGGTSRSSTNNLLLQQLTQITQSLSSATTSTSSTNPTTMAMLAMVMGMSRRA